MLPNASLTFFFVSNQIPLIVVEMEPLNSKPVDKQVVNGSGGLKGLLHEVSNVDKRFSGKLHQ